jgi:hypothetical protein
LASLPPVGRRTLALPGQVMLVGTADVSATVRIAMLPLGPETGRHIRAGDERDPHAAITRDQDPKPVAQTSNHDCYAMLPLGTETGRHIRNLNENDRQPEKTVNAKTPIATA